MTHYQSDFYLLHSHLGQLKEVVLSRQCFGGTVAPYPKDLQLVA